jgi:hypothetical protein
MEEELTFLNGVFPFETVGLSNVSSNVFQVNGLSSSELEGVDKFTFFVKQIYGFKEMSYLFEIANYTSDIQLENAKMVFIIRFPRYTSTEFRFLLVVDRVVYAVEDLDVSSITSNVPHLETMKKLDVFYKNKWVNVAVNNVSFMKIYDTNFEKSIIFRVMNAISLHYFFEITCNELNKIGLKHAPSFDLFSGDFSDRNFDISSVLSALDMFEYDILDKILRTLLRNKRCRPIYKNNLNIKDFLATLLSVLLSISSKHKLDQNIRSLFENDISKTNACKLLLVVDSIPLVPLDLEEVEDSFSFVSDMIEIKNVNPRDSDRLFYIFDIMSKSGHAKGVRSKVNNKLLYSGYSNQEIREARSALSGDFQYQSYITDYYKNVFSKISKAMVVEDFNNINVSASLKEAENPKIEFVNFLKPSVAIERRAPVLVPIEQFKFRRDIEISDTSKAVDEIKGHSIHVIKRKELPFPDISLPSPPTVEEQEKTGQNWNRFLEENYLTESLYDPLKKQREMAIIGDTLLTTELYKHIVQLNLSPKLMTKDYFQTQRNLICSNENLAKYYDQFLATEFGHLMVLQGNQYLTLKMKGTFYEALVYYYFILDRTKYDDLIRSLLVFSKLLEK